MKDRSVLETFNIIVSYGSQIKKFVQRWLVNRERIYER